SGLRLSEAVALDWTDGPFVLDTLGRHPAFVIDAAGQKSRRSEVVPCTPDFGQWILAETPEVDRVGRVFPIVNHETGQPVSAHRVGEIVCKIGRKAGIVVGETERVRKDEAGNLTRETVKLFAGAHDLRRGFCTRWSKRVMPAVLKRLARHSDISTTMGYYVSLGADDMAADLWANHGPECSPGGFGNNVGNTTEEKAHAGK
ncbi:MAG: site-specific integrase, partial [Pirellulales bacterium]|nr:site-specific integrase [Pirellulales bacterium]